jgi:hypothetical protein
MIEDMFSFIDPVIDLNEVGFSEFIAQMEEQLGTPETLDPQGSRYELYLLLQRLKSGNMSFEQFLVQAKAWAEG